MSKLTLTGLALPLLLLFASPPASAPKAFGATKETPESQGQTGTLQKMIVESGSVTMDLDVNRLNGITFVPGRPTTLQFAVAANSFFPILVFNELLRGPEPGSMALIPAGVNTSGYSLPAALARRSSSSWSKNFPRVKASIWPCATARRDSPFSTSKEANTITMQRRSCSASPADACWSPKNLQSPWPPVRRRGNCGRNLDRCSHATDRDHAARPKRRCEIREAASAESTRRRNCPRP